MTVRAVEGKLPYTGGKAITVDENKVISLNLRDENNLIIYDQGDDEIYVDLQLPDGIRPNYAFPVGITTGRVLVADDWDVTGTIIVAKTTSGDVIKLLYGDDGTLWMDNGTGLFKQIYFKADVDLIITNLTTYINTELAKKQDKLIAGNNISIASDGKTISAIIPPLARFLSLWDCETGEPTSFPASTPFTYATGDYYLVGTVDTTTNYRPNGSSYTGTASSTVETSTVVVGDVYIYDGSAWLLQKNSGTGGAGDVQVSTDTGNLLSTGVKLWLGDKSDFDDLGSLDANTIYAPIEGRGGGVWTWQPTDAKCWYKFDGTYSDDTGTYGNATGTSTFVTLDSGCNVLQTDGTNLVLLPSALTSTAMTTYTVAFWVKIITTSPAYGYYAGSGASNGAMMCFYESTSGRNFFEWGTNGTNNTRDITPTGMGADWRLVCLRSNGTGRSNVSLIINGQYNMASGGTSGSDTSSIFGYANGGQFVIGGRYPNASGSGQLTSIQMSSFVISTSYWDDATCLAMYEGTKSNYGIS